MANHFKPKKMLANATAVLAVFIALLMVSSGSVAAIDFSSSDLQSNKAETVDLVIPDENPGMLHRNVFTEANPESAPVAIPEPLAITGDIIFRQTFESPWWMHPQTGWYAPTGDALFGDVPVPQFWDAIVTNDELNVYGTPMYWHQATPGFEGDFRACVGMDEDYCNDGIFQDEWIITPEITLTQESILYFWSFYGGYDQPTDDHDYVKISTDNGCSWETIIDLSYDLPTNMWDYEVGIDLSDYVGDTIRIAFNRYFEGPWENVIHDWCIDDVRIIEVPMHDVGVTGIVEPTSGTVGHGAGVVVDCEDVEMPICVDVANFGLADETDVNVTLQITELGAPITILDESFDAGWNGWTWDDMDVDGLGWEVMAGYAICDSDANWAADDILWSPTMDCSALAAVTLEFTHDYNDLGSTAYVLVDDGMGGWWIYDDFGGADSVGTFSYDITAHAAGNTDVRVGFYYIAGWHWWWIIDEVTVSAPGSSTLVYEDEILVDIASGAEETFCFPAWEPNYWHVAEDLTVSYVIEACTNLLDDEFNYIDEVPANDCSNTVIDLYYPFFDDVGVLEIVSPADGLATCTNPEIVVYNFGQYKECCFMVDIEILATPGSQLVWLEDFEGGMQPAGWTQISYDDECPGFWDMGMYGEDYYEPAGDGNYYMEADSDEYSMNIFDVGLFTPELDLSAYAPSVNLEFDMVFQDFAGGDIFAVYMHDNGTRILLQDWTVDTAATHVAIPIDVTTLEDPTTIMFEFYYFADDTWQWKAAIDNVALIVPNEAYDAYSDEVCIAGDICVGEERVVTFEEWCPPELNDPLTNYDIDYTVTACTHLCYPMDEDVTNDCLTDIITYDFLHDAAVVEMLAPVEYAAGDPNDWVHYDDGTTVSNIGAGPGGFYWSTVFAGADLPAAGQLTTVDFVMAEEVPLEGKVLVWKGGSVVAEADWAASEPSWIRAELSSPVALDGSDLRVGMQVFDNPLGTDMFPAGAGPGPSVASDVSFDGVTWNALAGYGLDYNWNIWAGCVTPEPFYIGFHETPVSALIANLGVYDEDVEVSATAIDTADSSVVYSDSGILPLVAGAEAVFDFAAWTPGVAGTYQLTIEASVPFDENAGNGEIMVILVVDGEDPVSTATLAPGSPDGDNGWYVSDVFILLEATDDNALAGIYYMLDGGEVQTFTGGLIQVSSDGDHELEYWAVDASGNEETHHTVTFKIDQTAPSISLDYEVIDDGGLFGDPTIEITATASDALSGLDRVEWSTGETGMSITINAAITVSATAFDEAGNSASDSVTPESYTNA